MDTGESLSRSPRPRVKIIIQTGTIPLTEIGADVLENALFVHLTGNSFDGVKTQKISGTTSSYDLQVFRESTLNF